MDTFKIHSYGPRAVIIGDQNGKPVAKVYEAGTEAEGYDAGAKERCAANLKLLMAAPGTLAALRYVRRLVVTHGDADAISRLDAAIAAATVAS